MTTDATTDPRRAGRDDAAPAPTADTAPTAPSGPTEPPPGEPPAREGDRAPSFWRANAVTLVAGAVAAGLAAFVWFALPHERDVESLGTLLFKLTPYIAASVAIAWLDVAWAKRLRLDLILPPVCFLVFFAYFVPRLFWFAQQEDGFGDMYYHMLVLVPFIILSLVLAYRLGGGATSTTLRLAAALLLLQLSGIEDLAFQVVNKVGISDVWTWADHIAVRIGHHPTKNEAFVFIAAHFVAAALVLFVPGRLVRRVLRRG